MKENKILESKRKSAGGREREREGSGGGGGGEKVSERKIDRGYGPPQNGLSLSTS